MSLLIDQVLRERYQIQKLISRKQERRTYLATDLDNNTNVIVKLILFGQDFVWEDLKLFEREAATLESLQHPSIPQYLDFFDVDLDHAKGFAIVQSHIKARSLQDWVESGRNFSETELNEIAKELLQILDYLHRQQPPVIHRDMKPSNILLGDRNDNQLGSLYLIDFGSVQTAAHGGTVTVVGTYGYMPMEQFGGRAVAASDLYSLGATLVYLSTGLHPADLPQKELRLDFAHLSNISLKFKKWIAWLLEPDIAKRPSSAKEALDNIEQFSNIADVKPNFSISARFSSQIRLTSQEDTLAFEIPKEQIKFALGGSIKLGSIEYLAIISILFNFAISLFSGPDPWIFWLFILCLLIYIQFNTPIKRILKRILGQKHIFKNIFRQKIQFYNLQFKQSNGHIDVSLFGDKIKKKYLVQRGVLQAVFAGPNMLNYQLNIYTNQSKTPIAIRGSRAEIQWICDEINEWAGLEIEYEDLTT